MTLPIVACFVQHHSPTKSFHCVEKLAAITDLVVVALLVIVAILATLSHKGLPLGNLELGYLSRIGTLNPVAIFGFMAAASCLLFIDYITALVKLASQPRLREGAFLYTPNASMNTSVVPTK